jgi:DNA-binding transcriptional MerR regulator
VRNVRAYQDRGLLPPPEKRGRTGIYSDVHMARLRIISKLLERGYTIANIKDLLAAWEQGRDLNDILGLEVAVTSPWAEEAASYVDYEDLLQWFGEQITPDVLQKIIALDYVRPGRRPAARTQPAHS